VRIANTDGQGVFLRASRNPEDRVKAYAERTVMTVLGPSETDGGRTWVPVRAPDGLEGWVPAEYTVQVADETAVGTPTGVPQPVEGAIAGLNADALSAALRGQGFQCAEAAKLQDTLYWSCSISLDGAALLHSVKLWGARADAIQYVTLSTSRSGGQPNDAEAASLMGPLAAQLAGEQEGPRARDWVERTLSQVDDDAVATLTLGSLSFTLYGPPAARVLDVATSGGERPAANTSPAVDVTPQSTAAPELLSEFVIPGLDVGEVTRGYVRLGFACTEAEPLGDRLAWSCRKSALGLQYEIFLSGPSASQVEQVEGTFLSEGRTNDTVAADFLGALAQLSYVGADPGRARSWVNSALPNVGSDLGAETTIGGVSFRLSGEPGARSLRLVRSAPVPAVEVTTVE
jgi:hypothetical protein